MTPKRKTPAKAGASVSFNHLGGPTPSNKQVQICWYTKAPPSATINGKINNKSATSPRAIFPYTRSSWPPSSPTRRCPRSPRPRVYGKRTFRCKRGIEIGRRLAECHDNIFKACFQSVGSYEMWLLWLDREFAWSERTARRFIDVHEMMSKVSGNLPDLELPITSLYLLAAPSTPEPARQAVIAAAADDRLTHEQVKEIVEREVAKASAAGLQAADSKVVNLRDFARNKSVKAAQQSEFRSRIYREHAASMAHLARFKSENSQWFSDWRVGASLLQAMR